jgi:hypothetical protein
VATDIAKHGVNVNLGGRDHRFQARQSLLVQTSAVLLRAVLERFVDDRRNVFERYGYHAITISQPFRLSILTLEDSRRAQRGWLVQFVRLVLSDRFGPSLIHLLFCC